MEITGPEDRRIEVDEANRRMGLVQDNLVGVKRDDNRPLPLWSTTGAHRSSRRPPA